MKAKHISIYINKKKIQTFERSEGNEIKEIMIKINHKREIIIL